MKAITCPQCGATIENVSETSVIVDCEYCGARIMMDGPPKLQSSVREDAPISYEPQDTDNSPFRVVATIITLVVLAPVFIGILFMGKPKPKSFVQSTPAAKPSASPSSSPIIFTIDNTNTKPLP